MAKVELVINGGEHDVDSSFDEYADKVWQEFQLFTLIETLTSKRKVVQRKLDAARKRLKRATNRLNVLEKSFPSDTVWPVGIVSPL